MYNRTGHKFRLHCPTKHRPKVSSSEDSTRSNVIVIFCLARLWRGGGGGVVITLSFLFTLFRRKSGPVAHDLNIVPVNTSMSNEEETVFTVSIPLHLLSLQVSTSYSLVFEITVFTVFRCQYHYRSSP